MSDRKLTEVWSSTLDKRYAIEVHRIKPYRGELTIAEKGEVLLRKEVGLSYDAVFGPDVADVADWQDIAVNFADHRESQNGAGQDTQRN